MDDKAIDDAIATFRERIAKMEAGIEALESLRSTAGGESPAASVQQPTAKAMTTADLPRNAFYGMKIPDAILHYLSVSGVKQTAKQIYSALKIGGIHSKSKNIYSNVYTALIRLERAGEVKKFGMEWGLSEWFPSAGGRKRSRKDQPTESNGEGEKSDA